LKNIRNLEGFKYTFVMRTGWDFDIELTKANVKYNVAGINNRDSRLISMKISLRSSFPFISTYAASVRIARCYAL